MTGIWYSPEAPGYRFDVTQNGYLLEVCNADYWCGSGVTGRMDAKHNAVLIGMITGYGPRIQLSVKFDSPAHGIVTVDYCSVVSNGFNCGGGLRVGNRVNVYKM